MKKYDVVSAWKKDGFNKYKQQCSHNKNNKKHRYFMCLLIKADWTTIGKVNIKYPDFDALNRWLFDRTKYKKPLILLNDEQLQCVINKFEHEIVKQKFIKELQKI